VKEHLVNARNGWSQPPGWGPPHQTGWTSLVDPGPLPLQTARSVGRWLWPTLSVSGFVSVTGFVFGHDDPAPGLSLRGLCTIALAAAVIILLTLRRTTGPGPLARAVFEYAVVFLLAVLVATTGIDLDQAPTGAKQASATSDQRPALIKTIDGFRDWLGEWREWAHKETDHRAHASPAVPATALSPSTRRPL
jgi:hypothetical protein